MAANLIALLVLRQIAPELGEALAQQRMAAGDLVSHALLQSLGLTNMAAYALSLLWGVICVRRVHGLSWPLATSAVLCPVLLMLLARQLL